MRILAWGEAGWALADDLGGPAAREAILGPQPVWARSEGDLDENWHRFGEWFDIHPLALEDIRNERQRPKVEDYEGLTFAVLRIPRVRDGELEWTQVGVFLGEGFVLTASSEHVPELDLVEDRLLRLQSSDRPALDRVFHRVIDAIVDAWFPYMDEMEDTLEDLEDTVLDRASKEELAQIRDMKHRISKTRKVIAPMRETTLSLERGDHPNIGPDVRIYLRDVADHMIRLAERLDHVKEVALIAQETWNATLANQMNVVMKRLTMVAALLLIPSLMAGLGGMNFPNFPNWDYWTATGFIVGFTVLAGIVGWIKGWL